MGRRSNKYFFLEKPIKLSKGVRVIKRVAKGNQLRDFKGFLN